MEEANKNLNIIAQGAILLIIGSLVGKLFIYLFRLLAARIGSSEYGILSLGITIISFVGILALLGFDRGVLRFVSFYKGKEDNKMIKSYISSSLKFGLLSGIIFGALLFFGADLLAINFFKKPELAIVLKIFAFAVPLYVLSEILISIMKAYRRVNLIIITRNILEYASRVVVFFIFLLFGIKLTGAALSYGIAFLISTIAAFFIVNKKIFNFTNKEKNENVKKSLLSFSLPAMLNNIMEVLLISLDTIMIGYFMTSSDVGIYNAAYPNANLLGLLPGVLITMFAPTISELLAKEKIEESKKIFNQVSRWIVYATLPILSFVFLFSKEILSVLFGKEYVVGSLVLIVLSFGILFNVIALTARKSLEINKKTKVLFYYSIIALVMNFALNLVLIPKYGILGAAMASLVSFAIYSILCIYKCYKDITFIQSFVNFVKPIIAGILSVIIIFYLVNYFKISINLIILIILALAHLLLYLGILKLIKGINNEDKEMFYILIRKFLRK